MVENGAVLDKEQVEVLEAIMEITFMASTNICHQNFTDKEKVEAEVCTIYHQINYALTSSCLRKNNQFLTYVRRIGPLFQNNQIETQDS